MKMKKQFLIILLLFVNLTQAQITSNIISKVDFYNIKINNVSLLEITKTKGNQNQFKDVFPKTIIDSTIDNDEDYYDYTFNGFMIGFSENEISAFKIKNNDWSINIKGKKVTIGSDISILGNVIFNTRRNGDKSVVYQFCNGCNNFIYIEFNQKTHKILEIGFIDQT